LIWPNCYLLVLALVSLLHSAGHDSSKAVTVKHRTIDFVAADETTKLQMDLYSCAESNAGPAAKSLFIFAHGGGFFAGSRQHPLNVKFCEAIASQGIDVACIDYRLTQRGKGFGCGVSSEEKRLAIDAAAADFEQALETLQVDYSRRIVIGGSSAGGHAALYSAYHRRIDGVAGVISLSGAMEPTDQVHHLPLLAFHGTCDGLVPYGEALHHHCQRNAPGALLLQGGGALAECLPHVELHAYLNGGHYFANSCLSDSNVVSTCVHFIERAIGEHAIGGTFLYETTEVCTLPAPFLPCQH